MKPLICFYDSERFIYSEDYVLHRCTDSENIADFLTGIENRFQNNLKIVQINFEYNRPEIFSRQKPLYNSDPATVFVLQKFKLLTISELQHLLPNADFKNAQFTPLEARGEFLQKVQYIKQQISAGRIYQVNLTAPLVSDTAASPGAVFKNYFSDFTGQYKALLPLPQYDLISFSPELFLQKQGDLLKTRPIKGSRPQTEDFQQSLLSDTKEEAELSMIVDLLRNDLNRIDPDQASIVTAHRAELALGYIQHTYSEVTVQTNKSLAAILEATLPGGSISGCPKIESLHLIAEVEPYRRQAYTGTVGWWQNGDFCLNLCIRTFLKSENQLFYHAGCGIVYDSVAEKEWDEFLLKTGVLNAQP